MMVDSDDGTVISEDCFLCWAKESPAWDVLWYSIWNDDEVSIWLSVSLKSVYYKSKMNLLV